MSPRLSDRKTKPKRKAGARARCARAGGKKLDQWLRAAWVVPVALLIVCAGILLRPAQKNRVQMTSAKLLGLYQRAQDLGAVGDRIAFWSGNLVKDPALLAPLGAGAIKIDDTAPLFPPAYDCTTYVETVGALARSLDGADLTDRLLAIRYKNARVGFEFRNHFPEADWIPNNAAAGVLTDLTAEIARKSGLAVEHAEKTVDRAAWFRAQKNDRARRALASHAVATGPSRVLLPYVPLELVEQALVNAPQGVVVNVVRESKPRYPVLITHQGFLVWKNGVAYFRHASQNKRITEMPFAEYLRSLGSMPWKVLGFNFNAFTES